MMYRAGLEKVPSVRPGQEYFLTGQVTFHCYLPNKQGPRQESTKTCPIGTQNLRAASPKARQGSNPHILI